MVDQELVCAAFVYVAVDMKVGKFHQQGVVLGALQVKQPGLKEGQWNGARKALVTIPADSHTLTTYSDLSGVVFTTGLADMLKICRKIVQTPVGAISVVQLSLIHISEPTRLA